MHPANQQDLFEQCRGLDLAWRYLNQCKAEHWLNHMKSKPCVRADEMPKLLCDLRTLIDAMCPADIAFKLPKHEVRYEG